MKLNDKLDQIFDKHTRNPTQTTQVDSEGNEVKVISFDTVVLHAYETKKDLLALFESAMNEVIGDDDHEINGRQEYVPKSYEYIRNELRDELRKKVKEMTGGEDI